MRYLNWFLSFSPAKAAGFIGLLLFALAVAFGVGPFNFYAHELFAGMLGCLLLGYTIGASIHYKPLVKAAVTAILVLCTLHLNAQAAMLPAPGVAVSGSITVINGQSYQVITQPYHLQNGSLRYAAMYVPLPPTPTAPTRSGTAQVKPQPQPDTPKFVAGCIVVIIFAIVLGVIFYKVIKFCQTHFAPPPPANTNSDGRGQSPFPAYYGMQPITNGGINPSFVSDTGFSINMVIPPVGTNVTLTAGSFDSPNTDLVWSQFTNALAGTGVDPMFVGTTGQGSYSSNGIPVAASMLPYTVTFTNGAIAFLDGKPTRTLIIERRELLSADVWTPVITNIISSSITNITAYDQNALVDGSFYRARILTQ